MSNDNTTGFLDLADELQGYLDKVNNKNISDILEVGAGELTRDLKKLPTPRSNKNHSHLIDSFTYLKNAGHGTVSVGWGVYYGFYVEKGTTKMRAQPHLEPTFNKNKERYYQMMIDKFHGNR